MKCKAYYPKSSSGLSRNSASTHTVIVVVFVVVDDEVFGVSVVPVALLCTIRTFSVRKL